MSETLLAMSPPVANPSDELLLRCYETLSPLRSTPPGSHQGGLPYPCNLAECIEASRQTCVGGLNLECAEALTPLRPEPAAGGTGGGYETPPRRKGPRKKASENAKGALVRIRTAYQGPAGKCQGGSPDDG